jgi:hypothetical protein
MSVDPKIIDLINAGIDGEISKEDRARLDQHLARDPDALALQADLSSLCNELDAMESIAPPVHLKHVILNTIPRSSTAQKDAGGGAWSAAMSTLFGGSVVRYAMSFAVGAIFTLAFISSEQISRQALDNVSGLVGTISQPGQREFSGEQTSEDRIQLSLDEIAGSVQLNRSGSIMILDFDLASPGPIEIVVSFADRDIWFNGFAQLESSGTKIAAAEGSVTVRMEGQRRYAVYLNNSSLSAATLSLRFYADGALIHEDELNYGDSGQP